MQITDLLAEADKPKKLEIPKLPYSKDALAPIMSKKTIELHYDKLTKNYFNKFNELHDEWNEAGAFLHSVWWEQLETPEGANAPPKNVTSWIEEHYKSWVEFKDKFSEEAKGIHGSGWVALLKNGQIKVIPNHKKIENIVLLLDCWEHAYTLDYGSEKGKYVENFWKLINWEVVAVRLGVPK
jgi:superoxide dismutase, Fe-Mn family